MKAKWYANWLVIITLCLLFSSFGIFFFSVRNNISVTRCIYGDPLEENCICTVDGDVVCEQDLEIEEKVVSQDFVSSGLVFSYDFLNFIDVNTYTQENVRFTDISHLPEGLKIAVERTTLCNENRKAPVQVGFYKLQGEKLILTATSNLTDSSYYISCITRNTFLIENIGNQLPENFQILYQDELGVIYRANNCVYDGYLRGDGDMYNSQDGCTLCKCDSGENVCEQDSCLE